jgi:hypothetical protein
MSLGVSLDTAYCSFPFSPFSQKLASYDDQHGSRILAELTLKAWLASHVLIVVTGQFLAEWAEWVEHSFDLDSCHPVPDLGDNH